MLKIKNPFFKTRVFILKKKKKQISNKFKLMSTAGLGLNPNSLESKPNDLSLGHARSHTHNTHTHISLTRSIVELFSNSPP